MSTTLDAILGWIAADRHCGYRDGDVLRGEAAERAAGALPWGRQSCLNPQHAPAEVEGENSFAVVAPVDCSGPHDGEVVDMASDEAACPYAADGFVEDRGVVFCIDHDA